MHEFGTLLHTLRRSAGLSQKELAARSFLTQSYISQIERGQRNPPARDIVARLSRGLNLGNAAVSPLFEVCGYLLPPLEPPPSEDDGRPSGGAARRVPDLIDQWFGTRGRASTRVTGSSIEAARHPEEALPRRRRKLSGMAAIARTRIDLVRDLPAPSTRRHAKNEILLTYRGANLLDHAPYLRDRWQDALRAALAQGWHITQLVQIGEDAPRALGYVQDLLARFRPDSRGKFQARYFRTVEPITSSHDLLIVPRRGALQYFIDGSNPAASHAYFYPSWDQEAPYLAPLRDHFQWLRDQTDLLMRTYTHPDTDFEEAIAATESRPGDVGLVMDGLSSATVPAAIEQARAMPIIEAGRSSADLLTRLLPIRETRRQAFLHNLGAQRVRHVCPQSAIERFVETGVPASDDWLEAIGGIPETIAQRRDHLLHVIDLLDTTGYELALTGGDTRAIFETYWLVKRYHGILMEVPRSHLEGGIHIDVTITEPTIVKAFYQYFEHVWDSIPKERRQKHDVRTYLLGQVAHLAHAGQVIRPARPAG